MSDVPSEREPNRASEQADRGEARTPRFRTSDILQAASAAAGTAAIVYVVGGMVMWLRFRKAGLPPDEAVAQMERQQLLVIGLRLMVLPAALTGALAWLVMYRRGRRSTQLPAQTRWVLKTVLLVLAAAFAVLLPFSFASVTWVLAALVVVGYLRYERRPAGVPATDPAEVSRDEPRRELRAEVKRRVRPAETRREAARRANPRRLVRRAREWVTVLSGWLSKRSARSRRYVPLRRRVEHQASPLFATMLVVMVAAVVSLGRQLDQPVQLLDARVSVQDATRTVDGVYISSDGDEIFIGVNNEIKAIPRSTVREVTLGPPRERAPSPSIASRVVGRNRFAITPFEWWCNGERYGWEDVSELCQTQIQLFKKADQKVQRRDLAGDAVPLILRCPVAAKKPCRGFLGMSSKNRYQLGSAALPRSVVFGSRVRPVGAPDTAEAGIAPGTDKVMCLPVPASQRGLLRNTRPVEDPMHRMRPDVGTGKRRISFNVTISTDQEGLNVVRSEPYIVSVTRPNQPIEYWGDCSTLRVSCEATAGTKPKTDIKCTVRATRRFAGQVNVTIVSRDGTRYAKGNGEIDGKKLVMRPVAMRTLTPGRYQAVVLLERGNIVRKFWTFFNAR